MRRALLSFPMGSALPSCHTTGNSSFACDNPLDVGLNTYGHCTMVLCLLQLRGSTLARFRRGIWTSLPKTRPAEDHLGSKESAQSFQRAAWAGPQSRTLSIEMEGQGHRLRVGQFDWLFVLIVGGFYSEVALQKREAEGTARPKHQLNLDPNPGKPGRPTVR